MEHKQIVIQLHQLADFLAGKRFIKFFESNDSQFNVDVAPIYSKLRDDLSYACLPLMEPHIKDDYKQNRLITAKHLTCGITHIVDLAHKISKRYNITVTKKEKLFIVKCGDDPQKTINKTFGCLSLNCLCQSISLIDRPTMPLYSGVISHFISNFGCYVSAVSSLRLTHQNDKYTKMLRAIIENKGAEYFTSGYPMDLLVHDAIAANNDVNSLYVRVLKNHCSTIAVSYKPILDDTYTDYRLI